MSTTPIELSRWEAEIRKGFPELSKPVAGVLAQSSFGMVQARHSGRCQLSATLATLLNQKVDAVEQRLYEWCRLKVPKPGQTKARPDWNVQDCFAPLLKWIVRIWKGTQMALALDATTLDQRFTVLTISVVYRHTGIPVAWKIMPATEKQDWHTGWLDLIERLKPAIPSDWTVIALTDRGLYAKWLYDGIIKAGWHPCMRVNDQGCFRAKDDPSEDAKGKRYLRDFVPKDGTCPACKGVAFSEEKQIDCTLLCMHDKIYTDPWIVITDLSPEDCNIVWYALRCWCEQGFKCFKRGAWQWQHTRMTDPQRAERHWLAIALATLWCVAVGAQLEDDPLNGRLYQAWLQDKNQHKSTRKIRILRLGMLHIIAALCSGVQLPMPAVLSGFWLAPSPIQKT